MKRATWIVCLLLVGGGCWWWWQKQRALTQRFARENAALQAQLTATAQRATELERAMESRSQPAASVEPQRLPEDQHLELLRLRGEVTLLREQARTQALAVAEAQRAAATIAEMTAFRTGSSYQTGELLVGGETTRRRSGLIDVSVSAPPVVQANGRVQWHHDQATGAPDTTSAGDRPTAWAPRTARSGAQWLALGYDQAVEIGEINIHESYHPGAISRVAALMPDGSQRVLWEGVMEPGGDGLQVTSVPVPRGTTANQIVIHVDTDRVASWPEIDAVELVGVNGTRQWASSSSASSSYSETYGVRAP